MFMPLFLAYALRLYISHHLASPGMVSVIYQCLLKITVILLTLRAADVSFPRLA